MAYVHKPSRPPGAAITLGVNSWERLRRLLDCATDTALASRLGVDQSRISRIRNKNAYLDLALVARVQDTLLQEGIETADLFWLVRPDGAMVPLAVTCPGAAQRGGVTSLPERQAS